MADTKFTINSRKRKDARMSMLAVGILLITVLFAGFTKQHDTNRTSPLMAFRILTPDSAWVEVYELLDSFGTLNGYSSKFKTPVCEVEQCYDIVILFQWDLIGNFVRYDSLPGNPLTKQEHEPFTEEDYRKLSIILKEEQPHFATLTKAELIVRTKDENAVDGYSGATLLAIKDEIIPGAAYSCHTLWHIANGAVVDSIENHTRSNLDSIVIEKLLNSGSEGDQDFLIDHLSSTDFQKYFSEIMQMVQYREGYFAKRVMEQIPDNTLKDFDSQLQLSNVISQIDYFSNLSLINRFDIIPLGNDLAQGFIRGLRGGEKLSDQKVISLIKINRESLSIETLRQFQETVLNNDITVDKMTIKAISQTLKVKKKAIHKK